MYYRHNLNFKYPDRCDEHMITVNETKKVTVDESYPFLQKSFGFKLLRSIYWLGLNFIVFFLCRFTHGLKIYGKENLKKHRKELGNGAITISNHVFMWDYLCVLKAIRPHLAYFPAWKENLNGGFGSWIRMSGGIPIPTGSIRATINFKKALDEVLESGKYMHIYPEGSMWCYYPDIRPFKLGAFQLAVKHGKPIIPISISFRPRKGIYKLLGRKPLADLHIGEPIYPDKTLTSREAAEKMRAEAYHVMQMMNGIDPSSPTYNTDQNPDNYKKTM